MNIVLFGATDISLAIAEYLQESGYNISAIVTTPPAFKISYSVSGVRNSRHVDMVAWAQEHNIPAFLYENADSLMTDMEGINKDFAIVAGWYHMIPAKLRALFPRGCAGFHASLLPALRGGAPLNWAILTGLRETGVSFFELSDGVDDGLLYAQDKFSIKDDDYIGDLVEKSTSSILKMLKTCIPEIAKGCDVRFVQKGDISYCGQRAPEDSLVDWNDTPDEIVRLIRASSKPYPGAYTHLGGHKVTLWRAVVSQVSLMGAPGQIMIVDDGIYIVCGQGSILLQEYESDTNLLKAGQKRFSSASLTAPAK